MAANRRALIIASDRFADPKLKQLRSPSVDAAALARVLGSPAIGDFEVNLSFNEPEAVVRRRLSRFLIEAGRDDLLVLHMACHGIKDEEGNLHFATTDTYTSDLYATAVGADFVERLMARSPSRRIVLLLDCCYSGAFSAGMQVRGDPDVHVLEQFTGRGRAVLTASSAMEYAWESDEISGGGVPSVFTSAVVRGLESGEADRDGDGQISVDELYDYVLDAVRQVTPNQTPNKQIQMEGDLFLAKSVRGPKPVLSRLPPEVLQAARSPLAGVREGVVIELSRLLGSQDPGQARAAQVVLSELADDDSRRVSTAALGALRAVPAQPQSVAQTQGMPMPSSTRAGWKPRWPMFGVRTWWGVALRGAAALVAGLVTVSTAPAWLFVGILATYGVVHGLLELSAAGRRGATWLWRGVEGLACVVLSVLAVGVNANTDLVSDPTPELVLLALYCITMVAGDFVAGRVSHGGVERRALWLCGLAFACFGTVFIVGVSSAPQLSSEDSLTLLQIVGVLLSVSGAALLALGWWLRSATRRSVA